MIRKPGLPQSPPTKRTRVNGDTKESSRPSSVLRRFITAFKKSLVRISFTEVESLPDQPVGRVVDEFLKQRRLRRATPWRSPCWMRCAGRPPDRMKSGPLTKNGRTQIIITEFITR